jgi:catechol 2,3-dioxygenase-like lactoylglutathione lyase family enzyme
VDTASASFEGLTLHVKDVERARDFYARIPGVELERHLPGEFALFRIGDGWLGLLRAREPGFHVELAVADLDAAHARLLKSGIEPRGRPRQRGWGERTFVVVDPDGNQLEFQ